MRHDFGPDTAVEVKYPLNREQHDGDRSMWPWLPGTIVEQVGADEWLVCVVDDRLAALDDGSAPAAGTPDEDLCYPCCYRNSEELRLPG